jgi:hypothetical protein
VSIYYTYVIRDPRTFEPIYVGKGSRMRMYDHWRNMLAGKPSGNPKFYNKLTAIFRAGYLAPIYEKWLENAEEKLAFWMERFLIETIGMDTLCNATDGGMGLSGWVAPETTRRKHTGPFTAEHRQKIADANRGKIKSPAHCQNMSKALRGRIMSAEWREKQSKRCAGKPIHENTRLALLKSNVGRINSAETRQRMREAALKRWKKIPYGMATTCS